MDTEYPDLRLLEDVVHPKILQAMYGASQRLSEAGIPHALAGALAVGAWGYPRASKDFDFLLGAQAFHVHEGGFVTFDEAVPIAMDNIAIDPLSAGEDESFLEASIEEASVSYNVPILPISALVYMKLKSPRSKDRGDIVELVKAGIDIETVGAWLQEHVPEKLDKWRHILREAEE